MLYDEGWKKGVIGIVASRLTEIYFRPTIVLTRDGDMATGSARSVTGFDIYSAIKSCRDLLLNFGGHTYAAGLTLKWDKVREFRDRFQHYVEEHISPQQTEPMLNIDAEIDFKDITKHLQADLKRFSPFGPCNQKPIFWLHGPKGEKRFKSACRCLVMSLKSISASMLSIGSVCCKAKSALLHNAGTCL